MQLTKPRETPRKPVPQRKQRNEDLSEAARGPDTDGLSGQGSESVMAHLREQERRRVERSRKEQE